MKGNNELLSLTRPDVIREIHEQYLRRRRRHHRDQHLRRDRDRAGRLRPGGHRARDERRGGAPRARRLRQVLARRTSRASSPARSARTPQTASIRPDVNDPGARNITFDELRAAYCEQARGLVEGGADLFLVETIFDTLNAKAALFAIDELHSRSSRRAPAASSISGTVTDASGRILSGQTVERLLALACATRGRSPSA